MFDNKKGLVEVKNVIIGIIIFAAFSSTFFLAFGGTVTQNYYGRTNFEYSEVLTETNSTAQEIENAYRLFSGNNDPSQDTDVSLISGSWSVVKNLLSSVISYPFKLITAINNDIANIGGDKYSWLSVPLVWASAIVGIIVIGLIIGFAAAIFGKVFVK